VALVETVASSLAAVPDLQAGEGKTPTLAMSSFPFACLNKAYIRLRVGNHLPEYSDDDPEVECLLQQELLLFGRTTLRLVTDSVRATC
jgi:hypothetical protein